MSMIRVLDAKRGTLAEIRPAVPGLLRVCAHLPEHDRPEDITDLRVLLVADLLTRAAELSHQQTLVAVHSCGQSGSHAETLAGRVAALGIHAPAAQARCRDAQVALGGPIDVHLVSGGDATGDLDGQYVSIGPARLPATGDGSADARAAEASAWPSREPLAVRFALLSSPYHRPAEIARELLADAVRTLDEWRTLVAEWAELPSRPVPPHLAEAARAAFRDLDAVSALGLLRTLVSDTATAGGAKFETFVYADRVLGLEFAKRIGQL